MGNNLVPSRVLNIIPWPIELTEFLMKIQFSFFLKKLVDFSSYVFNAFCGYLWMQR
jgi:hypothetical protein